MSATEGLEILTYDAPGEFRAIAIDKDERPTHLFSETWSGAGSPARFGTIADARIRTFADELRGAFCTLETGEEVFMRLKARSGLTEGAKIRVEVRSEARQEKLARVVETTALANNQTAFQAWCAARSGREDPASVEDREAVDAAFDDAQSPELTLAGGGRLIVETTRALTAFDIDSAGRTGKGSAGARALRLNQIAASEMARQMSLRRLGGNAVLDCVGPINKQSADRVRMAALNAFHAFGLVQAKVLKPSEFGLLEASVPWQYRPLSETLASCSSETELLALFRDVQREATARPTRLFELSLCEEVWRAYLGRKSESDAALAAFFGGRVTVTAGDAEKSEILTR